jgi:hypothetical protein
MRKKYSADILNEACRIARANHICRYRSVKAFCEEQAGQTIKSQYSNQHEFLRDISQYQTITEEVK